ncbi:magnesium transporter [Eubacteriales bacterium OttesenSCG-928-A19]|nr:magnesium transporter [Eubacteriales bacterium OttesenSCG-928-A19]
MLVYERGKQLPQGAPLPGEASQVVIFIEMRELPLRSPIEGIDLLPSQVDESATNRFESRTGFDCILLNIPDKTEDVEAPHISVDIYLQKNHIVFVHDPFPAVERLKARLSGENGVGPLPFDSVAYAFLSELTAGDAAYLEQVEEEIAALEDDIAEDAHQNYLAQISTLRKKLLKQKRYFESLLDALEDLEENLNGLLTEEQLRAFHLITNRSDRQFHSVLNLRDYVTQVREAYQAQMDISLNRTMKLFTVVTTIFLPLTVLAGWYGMNLQMPEYLYPYSYPILIICAAVIVIGSIAYFRKNRWF